MTERRRKRNELVVSLVDRVKAADVTRSMSEVFAVVAASPENVQWCLSEETIRKIYYDKNYGGRSH